MLSLQRPPSLFRTTRLKLLDYAVEIRIATAKAPRKPVSTALGYRLAVSNHLELTGAARLGYRVDVKAFLDKGREPRDLGLIVVSGWAMNDFDPHSSFIVHPLKRLEEEVKGSRIRNTEFQALRRVFWHQAAVTQA
jgi:hypothetical protein